MGKLGKKARKFAKKNLQSVLKRKRQLKSVFKRRASKKDRQDATEDQEGDPIELSNVRKFGGEDIEDASLDSVFTEDDSDLGDDSDSDGYLSEDSKLAEDAGSESENCVEDKSGDNALLDQNREIHLELEKKRKQLEKLKKKDPEFSKFLQSYDKDVESFRNEELYSDEDKTSNDGMQEHDSKLDKGKLFTSSAINSWCKLVTDEHSVPALSSLLNGYRAACHYGTESTVVADDADLICKISNGDTFCKIVTFVLNEADDIFCGLLGISTSSCKKETILELKNTSKWKTLKPLVKSYLRSTLFLLNQVTDSEILAFSLSKLRASMILFAAFPSLLRRFIKIAVHLWATGGEILSSQAFLVICDVASVYSSDYFDICLVKTYKAFIGHCKYAEPALFKHIVFLRNSFVELCSQDVEKSYSKALVSIQLLAKIMQQGLRTKKKEAVKKICSFQYTNCIDLWVTFISANIRDSDLQPLLLMIIQIVNGVAYLFPGPRYLPLRLKCIRWLNTLSSSSGIFIPVASLVLDVLEFKTGKEGGKPGKAFNFSSATKLPKHWLKSRNFQEECVLSTIELLSVHFAQWSYHVSFPELATIPLIHLKKFHERMTIEGFRRVVKRFIDQVEQNVDFVQKKRDEVSFSPNDQQSVDTFLQFEKSNKITPFTQYYNSIIDKACSRNLTSNGKSSSPAAKKSKRKRQELPNDKLAIFVNVEMDSNTEQPSVDGRRDVKAGKKKRS